MAGEAGESKRSKREAYEAALDAVREQGRFGWGQGGRVHMPVMLAEFTAAAVDLVFDGLDQLAAAVARYEETAAKDRDAAALDRADQAKHRKLMWGLTIVIGASAVASGVGTVVQAFRQPAPIIVPTPVVNVTVPPAPPPVVNLPPAPAPVINLTVPERRVRAK